MIPVKIFKCHSNAVLPEYMSGGAAGCDVRACLDAPLTLAPGERAAVPTGLQVEIPAGFEIQVRPRSGLAFKKGLTVVNAPGTIDSDYRGEVKILLVNLSQEGVTIEPGDRIAQWVLGRVDWMEFQTVEQFADLSDSARGLGGFGSTGVGDPPASL